mgnify:CR=1 FL=1
MRELENKADLITYIAQTDTENADLRFLKSFYYESMVGYYGCFSDGEILDYLEEEDYNAPDFLTKFNEKGEPNG